MEFPVIIDNRSDATRFDRALNEMLLPVATRASIAVGYFYYSGFACIEPGLRNSPIVKNGAADGIRCIISPRTDRLTANLLTHALETDRALDVFFQDFEADLADAAPGAAAFFVDLLRAGIFHARVRTTDLFHAKCYLLESGRPEEIRQTSAIVGSSNFTRSGLTSNHELNLTKRETLHFNALTHWFEELWENNSREISAELLRIVESTPAGSVLRKPPGAECLSPYEFLLFLHRYYFGEAGVQDLQSGDTLAEFQRIGVENLMAKLERLGGAMLSDSVGLGKTFTAGEVIRRYRNANQRTAIITPPGLISQWRSALKEHFGLIESEGLQLISQGKLSQTAADDVTKLTGGPFDLIVVDEAHRARNRETRLWQRIQNLHPTDRSRRAHVLLLTATPFNNSIHDIKNLLDLCTERTALANAGLKPQALDEFKGFARELGQNREALAANPKYQNTIASVHEILNAIMLLRMRSTIKHRYGNIQIAGKPLVFHDPEVERREAHLPPAQEAIFDQIAPLVNRLHLPHIRLGSDSGGALLGLFGLLLFKRVESSFYALYQSLENLIAREQELAALLNSGEDIRQILRRFRRDLAERELFEADSGEDESADELPEPEAVQMQIDADIAAIRAFQSEHLAPLMQSADDPASLGDARVQAFAEFLATARFRKALVFTEYRDTARYLRRHLTAAIGAAKLRIESVMADDADLEAKLDRFAPRARNRDDIPEANEIDVLISTDVLAEGVNLQDADMVVNYDLPWNPMRIVQRVGRVNRIGSRDRVRVVNFAPAHSRARFINLVEILSSKIRQVAQLLGQEMAILGDADEVVSPREIGAHLGELDAARSLSDYESLSRRSALFQNLAGETEEDAFRQRLYHAAREAQVRQQDFARLSDRRNVERYAVLSANPGVVFRLYEIQGARRGRRAETLQRIWLCAGAGADPAKAEERHPVEFTERQLSDEARRRAGLGGGALQDLEAACDAEFERRLSERRAAFRAGRIGRDAAPQNPAQLKYVDFFKALKRETRLIGAASFLEVLQTADPEGGRILNDLIQTLEWHIFDQTKLRELSKALRLENIDPGLEPNPAAYPALAKIVLNFYERTILPDPALRGSVYQTDEITGERIATLYL